MSAWVFTRLWTSECLVNVEWFFPLYVSSFWKGLRDWGLKCLVESCWVGNTDLGSLWSAISHSSCFPFIGLCWPLEKTNTAPFTHFFPPFQIKEYPLSLSPAPPHQLYDPMPVFRKNHCFVILKLYHLFYVLPMSVYWSEPQGIISSES